MSIESSPNIKESSPLHILSIVERTDLSPREKKALPFALKLKKILDMGDNATLEDMDEADRLVDEIEKILKGTEGFNKEEKREELISWAAERVWDKDRQKAQEWVDRTFIIDEDEQKIKTEGNLHLAGNTNLKELPSDLSVDGELYLGGCSKLTKLPSGLHVISNLWLDGCINLTELPSDLKVEGNLRLLYLSRTSLIREAKKAKADGRIKGRILDEHFKPIP